MTRNMLALCFVLFRSHSALKIAIAEKETVATGSGSGSGSVSVVQQQVIQSILADVSDIVSQASGATIGNPVDVTTSKGAFSFVPQAATTFAGAVDADPPVVMSKGGGTVTITPAAQRALAGKVTPGTQIDFIIGVGTVGPVPTVLPSCPVFELGMTVGGIPIPVNNLADPVCVTLPSCTSASTCATWDAVAGAWDSSCASGTPPNCCYTCFSPKSGTGGSTGARGDPKATNMAGQKFEILAMGTFQLLSIANSQQSNKLTLDATIDRAGEMCGATYIKNVSMTGSWIQEFDSLTEVRIRAASDVPKHEALQIAFGLEEWRASKDMKKTNMIEKASAQKLEFLIHGVTIETQIDAHRIRKNGAKTKKFANFLNVNVRGLKGVKEQGVNLGGLLAYDDYSFATQAPDGCKSGKIANLKQKLEPLESDVQMTFLSSVDVQ